MTAEAFQDLFKGTDLNHDNAGEVAQALRTHVAIESWRSSAANLLQVSLSLTLAGFAPFFTKREFNRTYQIFNNEEVQEFRKDVQDGIYHLFVLHADNALPEEFTNLKYGQNVTISNISNLYFFIYISSQLKSSFTCITACYYESANFPKQQNT